MKLAIIPARSGSKRIKNKNIKNFFGKPIIYWSIKLAIETNLLIKLLSQLIVTKLQNFPEVMVQKLHLLDQKIFLMIMLIPMRLSSILLNGHKKIDFDYVCCIYPTAPFLTKNIKKV